MNQVSAAPVTEPTVLCEKCKQPISRTALIGSGYVCPLCGKYNRIPARTRIELLTDKGSFCEHNATLVGENPIGFPGYEEKIRTAREKSGEYEGVICGEAEIGGERCCIFVMESAFMMGSMGTAVGDKIALLFEYATAKKLPVIGYTVSGGARMQEGMLSLMQMAKVSGAVKHHSEAGLFYLVCLTDPTTGGVTASFAMLGDMIIAEPGALIGFAGRRVIEQVMGQKLPDEFQSAEFQMKNGFVDAIVPREEQRNFLSRMLRLHTGR
ncbi:MAG: acetyl-CoA carboxylase carboxyl transferase subunit beta [Clostridia bacterium]|nr:acetyl-CoA carboxylase carboxyl transferase subunit beta [Clostridia bacterium]